MRPIHPPEWVTVLPEALQGVACASCHRDGAKWARCGSEGSQDPICSFCIFYRTGWGSGIREDLERLIGCRERAQQITLQRDSHGQVESRADLDLLLAAIVLPSRMAARRSLG